MNIKDVNWMLLSALLATKIIRGLEKMMEKDQEQGAKPKHPRHFTYGGRDWEEKGDSAESWLLVSIYTSWRNFPDMA